MVKWYGSVHVPSGWPEAVGPPGSEDWEVTAAAWLLDLIPEYRLYPALRRHLVVLAYIARHAVNGAIEGARPGCHVLLGSLTPGRGKMAIDSSLGKDS
jgi:hypothetical protein